MIIRTQLLIASILLSFGARAQLKDIRPTGEQKRTARQAHQTHE